MTTPLVIGIDASTTACKAIAWDRDGRAVAVGRSTQVFYDYAAQRTVPVPHDVRQAIIALDGPEIV